MPTIVLSAGGQSNMVGFRMLLDFIPSRAPDDYIPFYVNLHNVGGPNDLGPVLLEDDTNSRGFRGGNGFVPEGYASYGYNAELILATLFSDANTNVVVQRTATGNTGLTRAWDLETGFTWGQFTGYLAEATATAEDMAAEGDGEFIYPLIWWQGENDASNMDAANAYYDNLWALINEYRALVDDPEAPVVIMLTVRGGFPEAREIVLAAQRQIASEDPNIFAYDPSHLRGYSDGVHFWRESALQAGIEIAAMLQDAGILDTVNVWGTLEDDVVTGDGESQSLWGFVGDDSLYGMAGDDTLAGDMGPTCWMAARALTGRSIPLISPGSRSTWTAARAKAALPRVTSWWTSSTSPGAMRQTC